MVKPNAKPKFRLTYIRQWRKHRGLTLEYLADRVGTTHATLSRVERGMQPYGQDLLERLADVLGTDTASLLVRDPADPEGIWSVWDRASPSERRQIVKIAEALIKGGGDRTPSDERHRIVKTAKTTKTST
jgi:transcriptional regulator with XRE-family HTH domain